MNNPIYLNKIFIHPQIGKCYMELRQGLNVILSKNITDVTEDEFKITNSVGKTSFIKLIDYLLGKTEYILRKGKEVVELFTGRYLIAEVSFNDKKFTIKRSILEHQEIFIFEGWVAHEIIKSNDNNRTSYDLGGYISFLNKTIYENRNIIDDKAYVTHRTIMNYLIRDQANGFAKYDSGISEEGAEQRKKRLEFLLGQVTEQRAILESEIKNLNKNKKEINSEKNILKNYFQLTIEKSKKDLRFKIRNNEKSLANLQKQLKEKIETIGKSAENYNKFMLRKNNLGKKLTDITEDIEILKVKHKNYKLAVNDIKNELYKLNNIKLSIEILNPFEFKRCPVYLKNLKNDTEICSYIRNDNDSSENGNMIEARRKILIFEKKDLEQAIVKTQELIEKLKDEKNEITDLIITVDNEIKSIQASETKEIDNLKDKIREIEYENISSKKELDSFEYIDKLGAKIKIVNGQVTERKKHLQSIITANTDELNKIFKGVIEFITNDTRVGAIDYKTYKPTILFKNGNEDTGAGMHNLAVIAFDISMLELSLKCDEVGKYYPKFLIHDSPKHNDLQLQLYNKVFDYIIKLENIYFPQKKYFQYIITTLDVSEQVLKDDDKFIRLQLDNSGVGGKLYGCEIEII
jgi:predicted  nucleic acid-binding Zn-ribbon protein